MSTLSRALCRTGLNLAIAAGALGAVPAVQAQVLGSTQTYRDVVFSLSNVTQSLGIPSSCNEIRIDASGDFANSTKFTLFGALNCQTTGTAYSLAGSGYFGFDGTLNMAMIMGNGLALRCPTLAGYAGNCTFHNSAGVQVGTATVALKP
jgi:hypothetical protein